MNRSAQLLRGCHWLLGSQCRRGFTLIEMLTVVVILGILASFVTSAAIAARKRARIFAIHQEVMQLDMAVRNVQSDFGDYPPDFCDYNGSDSPAVDRWLQRTFPRYALTGSNTSLSQQMVSDIQTNYQVNVANPASALVVFLGGVPAVAGNYFGYSVQNPNGTAIPWRADGFNADPTCPFSPGQPRIKGTFEFPSIRVDTSTSMPCFCPPGVSTTPPLCIPAPYIYFRAGLDQSSGAWCYNYCYNNATSSYLTQRFPGNTDYAVPYQKFVPLGNNAVINPPWRNNDTFQIISSGLDGLYGTIPSRVSGSPQGLSVNDFDNITNFVQNGSTLEDELKK